MLSLGVAACDSGGDSTQDVAFSSDTGDGVGSGDGNGDSDGDSGATDGGSAGQEGDSGSEEGGSSGDNGDSGSGDGNGNGNEGPIYAVGDSVLEFHIDEGGSIPEVAAEVAGYDVVNAALGGAMVLEGENRIPNQYEPGGWSWVIVEGGANDLGDGCGCGDCMFVVDQLISADSSEGAMVELLERIEADGHDILLAGYYRIPSNAEEFVECSEEFEALNARYEAYADSHDQVVFVDMGVAMDGTDQSLYAEDLVHPSLAGSQAVGTLVGETILAN
ncbi:MAG: SGNH/GDSL hydrolase family protein [Myxococcota bacterium]